MKKKIPELNKKYSSLIRPFKVILFLIYSRCGVAEEAAVEAEAIKGR